MHYLLTEEKLQNSHYCRHVPYWQTALRRHHTPLLQGCRAGTSRLCQPAHSANMSGPAKREDIGKVTVSANNHQCLPHWTNRGNSKTGAAGSFMVNVPIDTSASLYSQNPFFVL